MASPSLDAVALVLDHAELHAENAVQFRRMLDRIRDAAGLNCGQIAVKTGMPRSQAYNLVSGARKTLPSRRDQVAAFVQACNLAPVQVDIVLDIWKKLNDKQVADRSQAHQERVLTATAFGDLGEHNRTDAVEVLKNLVDQNDPVELQNLCRVLVGVSTSVESTPLPRNAHMIDLVHYLVSNEFRLRRALRLLYPLLAVVLVIIVGLVVLAIWQPAAAGSVSIALASVAVPVVMLGRVRRRR
jgi:chloramphenicol 3-O-phosphotransferase